MCRKKRVCSEASMRLRPHDDGFEDEAAHADAARRRAHALRPDEREHLAFAAGCPSGGSSGR
jgi:hypothetical protein